MGEFSANRTILDAKLNPNVTSFCADYLLFLIAQCVIYIIRSRKMSDKAIFKKTIFALLPTIITMSVATHAALFLVGGILFKRNKMSCLAFTFYSIAPVFSSCMFYTCFLKWKMFFMGLGILFPQIIWQVCFSTTEDYKIFTFDNRENNILWMCFTISSVIATIANYLVIGYTYKKHLSGKVDNLEEEKA